MSLSTPDQVQTLRRKLYLKAKRELHKHRVQSRGEYRYPATYIYDTHRRASYACDSVHAFRQNLVREPDAGNPHVRFDERGGET